MKTRWAYQTKDKEELPVILEDEPKVQGWRCVVCGESADMLYSGTSYCQKDLKECMRLGTA